MLRGFGKIVSAVAVILMTLSVAPSVVLVGYGVLSKPRAFSPKGQLACYQLDSV